MTGEKCFKVLKQIDVVLYLILLKTIKWSLTPLFLMGNLSSEKELHNEFLELYKMAKKEDSWNCQWNVLEDWPPGARLYFFNDISNGGEMLMLTVAQCVLAMRWRTSREVRCVFTCRPDWGLFICYGRSSGLEVRWGLQVPLGHCTCSLIASASSSEAQTISSANTYWAPAVRLLCC